MTQTPSQPGSGGLGVFGVSMVLLAAVAAGGITGYMTSELFGRSSAVGTGTGAIVATFVAILLFVLMRPPTSSAAAPAQAAPAQATTAKAPAASLGAANSGHWSGGVAAGSAEGATAPPGGSGPSEIKPSTELAGEATLREDVGNWKYGEDGAPAPESAAAAPAAGGGAKPETLSAARDGKADDLKQIKGVGPKLEQLLNSMGFYHFDQVAAWTSEEVAWVDENLEGFKGRVSRDNWVAQAKVLAEGGATDFSKRVKEGDVY
ncbi:MAG: endonuclease [Pseudomonadota bacterium]